jgi:hypothetical protein
MYHNVFSKIEPSLPQVLSCEWVATSLNGNHSATDGLIQSAVPNLLPAGVLVEQNAFACGLFREFSVTM